MKMYIVIYDQYIGLYEINLYCRKRKSIQIHSENAKIVIFIDFCALPATVFFCIGYNYF